MNQPLNQCPVCGKGLIITRYECPQCEIEIIGSFRSSPYNQIGIEEKQFLEVFVKYGGNFREIGRILGISYPTVKVRLKSLQDALGFSAPQLDGESKASVLDLLEMGEISPQEAIELLKNE